MEDPKTSSPLKDLNDEWNATAETCGGVGGEELVSPSVASPRTHLTHVEKKGPKTETTNVNEIETGGHKETLPTTEGEGVHLCPKHESGAYCA